MPKRKNSQSAFTRSLFDSELPEDWCLMPVGDALLRTQYGLSVPGDTAGNTPIVGMRDIRNGYVNLTDLSTVDDGGADWTEMRLRRGDILLNRTNSADLVGKVGIVSADSEAVFASYLVRLDVNREQADPEFVNFWLNTVVAQTALKRLSTRGVSQANINPTEFRKHCPLPLPPLPEQRKIAEILRTWDEAIEKLEALRTVKDQRRKGVSQILCAIDGPFPSHWESKPLEEISERIRRTNDGGDHPVMTISAKSGFLMQSDKFARDMAGSSVDRYTLLQEGEFAYNKGNSKTAPYGCVFQLNRPSAVIPFVYFCFKLNAGLHHPFYRHLFAAGALNHQLSRLINSGVRNDGLLNLYAEDFFKCQVPVPPLAEQQEIAAILTAANKEIELLDKQIEVVTSQKRGLMQKLLTGEWRVDDFSKEGMVA